MVFYCVVKIKSKVFYCVVKIKSITLQALQALQHRAPGASTRARDRRARVLAPHSRLSEAIIHLIIKEISQR
jgi:hypothetical protein